jgi:glycosidase
VAVSYVFERDQARVSLVKRGKGVVIEHAFDSIAQLEPEQAVVVGTQSIDVLQGNEQDPRAGLRRMADGLGNGPPTDQPGHLKKLTLCEVHPWGRLESWNRGDTGSRFDRLTRLIPYYRELGITGLWLLPVSWPPPWVYTLKDFEAVAPENGTPEQLRELVQTAHRNGMKMLIDLVVYGIHPDADEVKRLPEDVWCRDRDGKPTRVWGGTVLAADTTHPSWQRRIAEVAGRWARAFGFDGTRLDCIGWGQTVNWAAKRPGDAVAYGGLQLNKVVRDAMRKANPNAVTLPEGGKPLVFRHADMVFDYPLYLAMRDLTWQPDLARWVADMREWLEWERCAYPQRALRGLVRFLECHDIVAATEYFGVGPSQALMAACVFMQGVPLIQQEQEIGFSADLASWLRLRNREPAFHAGSADYLATSCSDPEVLTFVRRASGSAAVVAINMTGQARTCTVTWPKELGAALPYAFDAFTGERVGGSAAASPSHGASPSRGASSSRGALWSGALPSSARITIAPYRPAVILLRESGASVSPLTKPRPDWRVATSEGTLADRECDQAVRLKPGERIEDALPTLGRARRAAEIGLNDGIVPEGVMGGPVSVSVSPMFVTMANGRIRLTLARRHGGVIASFDHVRSGKPIPTILPGGDCYTDNGFFPNRLYASVDGETNPRVTYARSGDAVTVAFRGTLRQRSWNGVQTCAVPGPPVAYELAYAVDASDRVACRLALTPSADVAPGIAFYALRVPLAAFGGWERAGASGRSGVELGTRLGQSGRPDDPLTVMAGGGRLIVESGNGMRSAFVIESGDATAHLFLAMLDGGAPPIRAGETIRAEAALRVTR